MSDFLDDGLTWGESLPPPDLPQDPTGEEWRGPPGPQGPQGVPGPTGGITGGTMTGPLYYTTTGATVSRSAQDRAADVVNVVDHGAVGDGQSVVTNVTLSTSGRTVTVADPIFAVSDVGKIIGICRVAAPALCAWVNYTTISAFTSPTQITVAATPGNNFASASSVVAWGTNNSAAFQRACDRVRDIGGGTMVIPARRYCVGDKVFLYSNTEVVGGGPASEIINCGITGSQSSNTTGAVFSNYNAYLWPGATHRKRGQPDDTPTTSANQIDHHITIRSLFFNAAAQNTGGAAKTVLFTLARNVKVIDCRFNYPALAGVPMSFIGCDDIEERGNDSINCSIGHDHWGGITRCRIYSNTIRMMPNTAIQCININAVGTSSSDAEVTNDIYIAGNVIELNGGPAGRLVAFFLDGLGRGSVTKRIVVRDNFCIVAGGSNHTPLVFRGEGGQGSIENNTFVGFDGGITIGCINDSGVSLTDPLMTQNGSTTATLTFPGHSIVAGGVSNGVYVHAPGITVGGVALDGLPYAKNELRVLSVVDANTLTVRLPAAATSDAVGGGTATWWVSRGFTNGLSIRGNCFVDPVGAAGSMAYLMEVAGLNHEVGTNRVVFSDPATAVVPYQTILRCARYGGDNQMTARRQIGPAGSGPVAGYSGDGNIAWASTPDSNKPAMPDYDATAITTPSIGDSSTAVATTAFVERGFGYLTPTITDGMTLTAAQTGGRVIRGIGSLAAQAQVTLPTTGQRKQWVFQNGTSGGQNVGIKGGAGSTMWVPPGYEVEVWSDGANLNSSGRLVPTLRVGGADRNGIILTAGNPATGVSTITMGGSGGLQFGTMSLGFQGATPVAKPTVTGSRGGNAALASLLTALASMGLVIDSSTA